MIRVEPFRPEHIEAIVLGELGQREMAWHDLRALRKTYGDAGMRGFTATNGGRVLFCAGHVERHPQYATLWAVYAADIGPRSWGRLLQIARDYADGLPHRRVDAMVDAAAPMAVRWSEAIGLTREAVMAEAAPDGGDMLVMRRIEQ